MNAEERERSKLVFKRTFKTVDIGQLENGKMTSDQLHTLRKATKVDSLDK